MTAQPYNRFVFVSWSWHCRVMETRLRLQLHNAIYRPDSFVLMLSYCANLKAIRYESTSLNRILADKSHRVIVALREIFTSNNFKTFLNGWARTNKPISERDSSIIIHVKHYICKVKTDSQENLLGTQNCLHHHDIKNAKATRCLLQSAFCTSEGSTCKV